MVETGGYVRVMHIASFFCKRKQIVRENCVFVTDLSQPLRYNKKQERDNIFVMHVRIQNMMKGDYICRLPILKFL